MKMIWHAAAVAALACAGTAQAASIVLTGQFDVTNTFIAAPNGNMTVDHIGVRAYSFAGDTDTGLFSFGGIFLGVPACTNCFKLSVSGSKVSLGFLGNNPPLPGSVGAGVTWTFDQDLLGDVLNVYNANMVSGSVYAMTSGRTGTNEFTGPAVSFSASVPEPRAWTMMIVGIAIVGASLRRKNTIVYA